MHRLIFFLILNLLALGALRALGGWLRSRRFLVLYGVGAVLSLGAWSVPLMLGRGIHGTVPGVLPFRVFATFWLVALLGVLMLAVPILVLQRFVAWRARRMGVVASPPRPGGPSGGTIGEGANMGRRDLLTRFGAAVPLVAGAGTLAGITTGIAGFRIRRYDVFVRNLPPGLKGFRIGQITDVHVGPFITVDDLARAVDAMNDEGVDLQVMTGDLIDDTTLLDGTMAALDRCSAPRGMYAVLGNHEHWRGLDRIVAAFARSRARLLVDESVVLELDEARLRIVGVDYPMRSFGPRPQVMRRSAERAFAGVGADDLVLCLSHHPDFFPFAAEHGARLTLAGHTHGGQVAPLGVPLFRFAFEHMLGWYQRGDAHLYVSGGTGHWLPFRIGVPPEVTILTLRAGEGRARS